MTYKSIYNDIAQFRSSGGINNPNGFHFTDTPGRYYFKLFFYMDNGGLLDRRLFNGEYTDRPHEKGVVFNNSALNYLMMNGEYERAELLEQFINLLSNINTHSPWYFSEVEGIVESIGRKQFIERDFKVDESRPMLTIKCLPDPVDDRIGTLLDLYKSVCYSYVQKKEIIPANLRRFTMGIYVFQTPKRMHTLRTEGKNEYATLEHNDNPYKSSTKYFEFTNCEFFVPSSSTAYASLNNKEGVEHNFEIGITYDDVYDERYNAFMLRTIGDYIMTDYQYKQNHNVVESVPQTNNDAKNYSIMRYETERIGASATEAMGEKVKLTETSMFERTKFGSAVKRSYKEAKLQAERMYEKYNPSAIAGTLLSGAEDYLVGKLDNALTSTAHDIQAIVKGNLFYDDMGAGIGVTQTLANGNVLGAIETVVDNARTNGNDDNEGGWTKKSLFK